MAQAKSQVAYDPQDSINRQSNRSKDKEQIAYTEGKHLSADWSNQLCKLTTTSTGKIHSTVLCILVPVSEIQKALDLLTPQ